MYDFVDRPVAMLDPGGRFLLWTLRNWVKALSDGHCPAATVGPAFAKWNMMAGFPPFHRMLTILNTHGRETISVAPLECRQVAEHEAILLALINSLQGHGPAVLRDTVALLVEEAYMGSALTAISLLGDAMRNAGIFPQKPQVVHGAIRKPDA